MATDLKMTTWVVTYLDHYSSAGDALAKKIEVCAAYYALEDYLVEFKDIGHQVVSAFHADVFLTASRVDAVEHNGADA